MTAFRVRNVPDAFNGEHALAKLTSRCLRAETKHIGLVAYTIAFFVGFGKSHLFSPCATLIRCSVFLVRSFLTNQIDAVHAVTRSKLVSFVRSSAR